MHKIMLFILYMYLTLIDKLNSINKYLEYQKLNYLSSEVHGEFFFSLVAFNRLFLGESEFFEFKILLIVFKTTSFLLPTDILITLFLLQIFCHLSLNSTRNISTTMQN